MADRTDVETTQQAAVRAVPQVEVAYAGFWLRAIAFIIDNVVLAFVLAFFLRRLLEHAGLSTSNPMILYTDRSRQALAVDLLLVMVQWLYWAVLESSPWQATVGKKLLGLYVTDRHGQRLTFGRASGRYFAKVISTLSLGVGYLMAGFTPKKQALHDLLAKCLVVKKTSPRPLAKI